MCPSLICPRDRDSLFLVAIQAADFEVPCKASTGAGTRVTVTMPGCGTIQGTRA